MGFTLSSLAAFVLLFLVSQSQATNSADNKEDNDFVGYSCSLGVSRSHIRIDYSHTNNGLPCHVNLIKSNGSAQFLLQAKRHLAACAIKAENMSQRLIDRGWSCQTAAL